MFKSCSICGGIHNENNMCKRQYKKNTKESKFRNSNAWIVKRERIKRRDKYLCQVCLKNNCYTYNNLQVHHIIPLAEQYEKRLDDNNLITLCTIHHKQAEIGTVTKEELYNILKVPRGVVHHK